MKQEELAEIFNRRADWTLNSLKIRGIKHMSEHRFVDTVTSIVAQLEHAIAERDAEIANLKAQSMDVFQTELGIWQDKTFPAKTNSSIIEHLSREVAELKKANESHMLAVNNTSFDNLCIELADVMLLAFGFAHHINILASDVVHAKFEICKSRKWGNPDASGVVEHIKSE